MEELDLLLQELALSSTHPENSDEGGGSNPDGELPSTVCSGSTRTGNASASNTYNELPTPVEASANSTKELDSILEELLGLGPEQQCVESKTEGEDRVDSESSGSSSAPKASTVSRKTDTIDDLLGGLSSDLEKIGVDTAAKGHCALCKKCIVGKIITALGEVWHPEHFVCVVCKTELSSTGFFERDGRPYCNKDYHQLFSHRCAYCKGPILHNILTALDQTWHPEHFFCAHCGGLFGSEDFLEKDGKPYCCKDFYHLFAPKCSGCGEAVRQNYLSAANGTWHPECFVCSDCLKPFTDGNFMELDGRPLCSYHFHSRQGTLCGGCGQPITGRCISALGRKFHPEHFVCAFCLRQVRQGIYKEQKGKPYCPTCFDKLFVGELGAA
ncbi:leupaxin [Takifugu rubripes]|uniref:Leupaxin n=1 Tax=Takifugu rubripes TaxID=31033 RepID=A0A3B5KC40_TAKRU|nr:leupaxin [Takifugu rubripes]